LTPKLRKGLGLSEKPQLTGCEAGPLDRLLRVFAHVEGGESRTTLLMLANIFLLLVGYYILKTVREPLILLSGGASSSRTPQPPRSRP
jgi:hypothetical protein